MGACVGAGRPRSTALTQGEVLLLAVGQQGQTSAGHGGGYSGEGGGGQNINQVPGSGGGGGSYAMSPGTTAALSAKPSTLYGTVAITRQ